MRYFSLFQAQISRNQVSTQGAKYSFDRGLRTAISATAIFSLCLTGIGAFAAPYQPPASKSVNFQGVDLARGVVNKSETFLSIGDPANGGLAWSFSGVPNISSFTGLIHLNTIPTFPTMTVSVGESSRVFYQGATESAGSDYGTLVHVGSTWVMTDKNGTAYTYDELVASTPHDSFAKLLSIQHPDGNIITINYNVCSSMPESCKIKSVVSNRGYALKYEYSVSGDLNKVWAVNTMAHTCDATITSCDAYDNYVTLPSVYQVTSALGHTTAIVSDYVGVAPDHFNMALISYLSPTGSQITTSYDYYGRIVTLTNAIGAWGYSYSDNTQVQIDQPGYRTVTVRDPANVIVAKTRVHKQYSDVLYAIDGLNRQVDYTSVAFISPGTSGTQNSKLIASIIQPEGNKSAYTYDARGNVTAVTNTPKAGSGLSVVNLLASYPTSCASPKTCNQPTWTKDAKGNQSDYTYDAGHGGMLTSTAPADSAGLRQRAYNTFTAYNTGSGTVYRLTRTETCALSPAQLTLTACPAASTTSVSITDYGTSVTAPTTYKTGFPYQITRTDGIGSLSATTTYAYDNIGNVVSVDGPLTGTSDQSFTTYDANRRKIFEIGAIPNGTLKRAVVKHTYDGDGRETKTERGYANTNATNGTDFVVTSFSRTTYDSAGRAIKIEAVLP